MANNVGALLNSDGNVEVTLGNVSLEDAVVDHSMAHADLAKELEDLSNVSDLQNGLDSVAVSMEGASDAASRRAAYMDYMSLNAEFGLGGETVSLESAGDNAYVITASLESVKDKAKGAAEWVKAKVKEIMNMIKRYFQKARAALAGYEKKFEKDLEAFNKLGGVKDDAKFTKKEVAMMDVHQLFLEATNHDGDLDKAALLAIPVEFKKDDNSISIPSGAKTVKTSLVDGAVSGTTYQAISIVGKTVVALAHSNDEDGNKQYKVEKLTVKSGEINKIKKAAKEAAVDADKLKTVIARYEVLKDVAKDLGEIEKKANDSFKDMVSGAETLGKNIADKKKELADEKGKDSKDEAKITSIEGEIETLKKQEKVLRRATVVIPQVATERTAAVLTLISRERTIGNAVKGYFKAD